MKKALFLQSAHEELSRQILEIQKFSQLKIEQLEYRPSPESWNILECIEHLNIYARLYLPKLEKALQDLPEKEISNIEYSLVGKYIIKSIISPKSSKTLKKYNPKSLDISLKSIPVLLKNLELEQNLLKNSSEKDILRKVIPLAFFPWIKLNVADTFQFLLLHQQRHILQMRKILAAYPN